MAQRRIKRPIRSRLTNAMIKQIMDARPKALTSEPPNDHDQCEILWDEDANELVIRFPSN